MSRQTERSREVVGVAGIEPATSCSQSMCATSALHPDGFVRDKSTQRAWFRRYLGAYSAPITYAGRLQGPPADEVGVCHRCDLEAATGSPIIPGQWRTLVARSAMADEHAACDLSPIDRQGWNAKIATHCTTFDAIYPKRNQQEWRARWPEEYGKPMLRPTDGSSRKTVAKFGQGVSRQQLGCELAGLVRSRTGLDEAVDEGRFHRYRGR